MLLNDVLPEKLRMCSYKYEVVLGDAISAELSGRRFVWAEYFCANYWCECQMVSVRLTEVDDDNACFGKALAILCCEWFGMGERYSVTLDDEFDQSVYAPIILDLYKNKISSSEYASIIILKHRLIKAQNELNELDDLVLDNPSNEPVKSTRIAGRNDPCPCGSGKKYKKCCLGKEAS
jgi:hypothetical protein